MQPARVPYNAWQSPVRFCPPDAGRTPSVVVNFQVSPQNATISCARLADLIKVKQFPDQINEYFTLTH